MSKQAEKLEAIRHAVSIAKRRLAQLDAKPWLTRAEQFEREMTVYTIQRGEAELEKSDA